MSEVNKTMENQGQPMNDGAVPAQTNETPAQTVATTPAAAPTEEKKPNWFKRHWKAVAAGAGAVVTAVGSAVVAYKKGKANGIASVPMPPMAEPEDYSLDPNVN